MSYITSSLARQSAIINSNNAEMAAIRANQGLQDLAKSGSGDMKALAQKELQLQLEKEQAEVKAKAAKAEAEALKNKKLNYYA